MRPCRNPPCPLGKPTAKLARTGRKQKCSTCRNGTPRAEGRWARPRSPFARRPDAEPGARTIRIGLPTKTYYPTIIAETALRQGLFAKEGIKAELTIYRSGAETFEAMAAGAADLQLNSAALVAAGRKKGV